MPTRLLREGIIDSEAVNSLSLGAEVFYRRLMSVADDYGLYAANPMLLLGKVFALRMHQIGVDEISAWLGECEAAGLIRRYQADGKAYLQILNFGQKARSAAKHPMPPEDPPEGEQGPAHEGHMRSVAHKPSTDGSDCGRSPASVNNCSQTADSREQMRALCGCEGVCECGDECVDKRSFEAGTASVSAERADSQSVHKSEKSEESSQQVDAAPQPVDPEQAEDPKPDPTPYREIVRAFNNIVATREVTWPAVQKKTQARMNAMRARWRTDAKQDVEAFRQLFERAANSDFLSGRNDRWTGCSFDWFMKPANWAKVVEGTYDGRNRNNAQNGPR